MLIVYGIKIIFLVLLSFLCLNAGSIVISWMPNPPEEEVIGYGLWRFPVDPKIANISDYLANEDKYYRWIGASNSLLATIPDDEKSFFYIAAYNKTGWGDFSQVVQYDPAKTMPSLLISQVLHPIDKIAAMKLTMRWTEGRTAVLQESSNLTNWGNPQEVVIGGVGQSNQNVWLDPEKRNEAYLYFNLNQMKFFRAAAKEVPSPPVSVSFQK